MQSATDATERTGIKRPHLGANPQGYLDPYP